MYGLNGTPGTLRALGTVARTAIRERFAYRGVWFAGVLTYGLFVFVFSRIWATVYAGRAQIAGYTQSMCVWYFATAELVTFGFGRFQALLDSEIKDGSIALLVARPLGFPAYQFARSMGPATAESAFFLVEGAIIALLAVGPPPFAAAAVPFMLLSLSLSGTLSFLLHLSIAMTGFWLEENIAFFWIFQKLMMMAGTLIPLEFLPGPARRVLGFTPFPSIAYAPARIAVGADAGETARLIAVQALWVLAAAALAAFVYRRGERKLVVNGG